MYKMEWIQSMCICMYATLLIMNNRNRINENGLFSVCMCEMSTRPTCPILSKVMFVLCTCSFFLSHPNYLAILRRTNKIQKQWRDKFLISNTWSIDFPPFITKEEIFESFSCFSNCFLSMICVKCSLIEKWSIYIKVKASYKSELLNNCVYVVCLTHRID